MIGHLFPLRPRPSDQAHLSLWTLGRSSTWASPCAALFSTGELGYRTRTLRQTPPDLTTPHSTFTFAWQGTLIIEAGYSSLAVSPLSFGKSISLHKLCEGRSFFWNATIPCKHPTHLCPRRRICQPLKDRSTSVDWHKHPIRGIRTAQYLNFNAYVVFHSSRLILSQDLANTRARPPPLDHDYA